MAIQNRGSQASGPGAAAYRALIRSARSDPNILGIILSGSRGAGRGTALSDHDIKIVVRDAVAGKYRRRFARPPPGLDVRVQGVYTFRHGADRAPQTEGYGPSFAHIKVPIDKTGRVAKVAREKARIPKNRVRSYTAAQLDGYVNEMLRSLQNFRDGNPLAGHLEATRSLPYLFETLFGSECRWAPYAKFLEWELRDFPLRNPPLPTEKLLRLVRRILRDGDVSGQRALLRAVDRTLRPRGYGRVLDSWSPAQLRLLRRGGRSQRPR
jgi:hypothetical protein